MKLSIKRSLLSLAAVIGCLIFLASCNEPTGSASTTHKCNDEAVAEVYQDSTSADTVYTFIGTSNSAAAELLKDDPTLLHGKWVLKDAVDEDGNTIELTINLRPDLTFTTKSNGEQNEGTYSVHEDKIITLSNDGVIANHWIFQLDPPGYMKLIIDFDIRELRFTGDFLKK